MGHFSPRALAAAMSRTVIRRPVAPPYSGWGAAVRSAWVVRGGWVVWPGCALPVCLAGTAAVVRSSVAAARGPFACGFITEPPVSRRPSGVPGHFDNDMPRARTKPLEYVSVTGISAGVLGDFGRGVRGFRPGCYGDFGGAAGWVTGLAARPGQDRVASRRAERGLRH